MNNFHDDDLLNLAKEKNQVEVDSQLAGKAMRGTSVTDRFLAALGVWMVAKGEKLQAHTAALSSNPLEFSHGHVKKATR